MTKYAVEPMDIPTVAIAGSDENSQSAGFIASAETTPSTHGKWDRIPIAIRRFSL